jgi:homoserine O-acetyltransferase/O-succinyltransferase
MNRIIGRSVFLNTIAGLGAMLLSCTAGVRAETSAPQLRVTEGNWIAKDFHFKSGEHLKDLRLHYLTIGSPIRDRGGAITNAVLILHSTASSAQQFLKPQFAGTLFGSGQPLDATRYYTIIPDAIGHGKSTKPSDGLRARFPQYEYDDMVLAQHALVTGGLGVSHLRLVMGTSMGCMHSWLWAETYPSFMDGVMPLGCLAGPISGRNRMWRTMLMRLIRSDPGYNEGDYAAEPTAALHVAAEMILIVSSGALELQNLAPSAASADQFLTEYAEHKVPDLDANDLLYALNASRNYDPSLKLRAISAPLVLINFADDFINPPELGIAEREIQSVRKGRLVLLPVSTETHGHLTHTWAALWQQYVRELMEDNHGG